MPVLVRVGSFIPPRRPVRVLLSAFGTVRQSRALLSHAEHRAGNGLVLVQCCELTTFASPPPKREFESIRVSDEADEQYQNRDVHARAESQRVPGGWQFDSQTFWRELWSSI